MRRNLVATLFLAGSALAFTACNNGAYDAHPDNDLSGAQNPLLPGSSVSVFLGSMETVINREKLLFVNAKYYVKEFVKPQNPDEVYIIREMIAEMPDDPIFKRNFYAVMNEEYYQSINDFSFPKEVYWDQFVYQVADTSVTNRLLFHKYMPSAEAGYFLFRVDAEDAGQYMRGKFSGVLYRAILAEDGVTPTGDFDMTDSVVISKAEFYLPKGDVQL